MVIGETLENRGLSLKIYLWAMALPFLANSFGWILAEMGRMPWIVYTLMTVDKGLSFTVPPVQMLITLLGFTLVYGALIVATIYLMAKYAKIVPPEQEGSIIDSDEDTPTLVPASD